jgi:hypothetical protein
VKNKGKEYPVSDPSKMMINISNEINKDHEVMHKEELKKGAQRRTQGGG